MEMWCSLRVMHAHIPLKEAPYMWRINIAPSANFYRARDRARVRFRMRLACVLLLACVDAQLTFHSGGPDRVDYVYKPLRIGERQPNQGVFSGIVPGAAIVAAAGGLLWWNEGRTLRRERLLDTARRQVVSHSGSHGETDPAAPEQLLHLTGWLRSAAGVSDPLFPQVKGELGLERMSEVFQWLEDERTEEVRTSSTHVRRETTYSYTKRWRHTTVESGRFRHSAAHRNPTPRVVPGVAPGVKERNNSHCSLSPKPRPIAIVLAESTVDSARKDRLSE